MANNESDMELFTACQAEAKEPPINISAMDTSPFMLGIRSVLKMSDVQVREAWLRTYQKEIKTLIVAKIFALDKPKDGEPVKPTMETNKVKFYSDGSLENLKCRIVVRGDLQETAMEDSWSPTVPFGPLKYFQQMQQETNAEYISQILWEPFYKPMSEEESLLLCPKLMEIFGLSSKNTVGDLSDQ